MNMISDAVSAIKNIRIQDVLDIAIIAAMIFALLTWFKTRASRFVLIGILLLGAVYLAARFLQLYLTVIVLQGFFAILLFVLVVIFQDDLRGVFERLAMFGNLGKVSAPVSALDRSADIIAEAAGNLAKKHIGALIVVHGTDPLGRHINGGTALDGQLSPVLLESIFTPNSPGHDGAVLVREDRALLFGVHLPSRPTSVSMKISACGIRRHLVCRNAPMPCVLLYRKKEERFPWRPAGLFPQFTVPPCSMKL